MLSNRRSLRVVVAALLVWPASRAAAETVDVYAAGSLRGLVAAIAADAASAGIEIHPTFAGSGTLRARIEKGEAPDLLLSADMASPAALASEHRALLPAVAFARNRLCVVARRTLGLTPATFADRLLTPGLRIRTSRPVADPSGDYAMAMFDRIGAARPGAGPKLRASAAALWDVAPPAPTPGQNATAALFQAGRIDAAVTYCSASGDIVRAGPDLDSVAVPDAYDPRPLYGLALLSPKPAAARLALLLVSQAGQGAVTRSGLLPLTPAP